MTSRRERMALRRGEAAQAATRNSTFSPTQTGRGEVCNSLNTNRCRHAFWLKGPTYHYVVQARQFRSRIWNAYFPRSMSRACRSTHRSVREFAWLYLDRRSSEPTPYIWRPFLGFAERYAAHSLANASAIRREACSREASSCSASSGAMSGTAFMVERRAPPSVSVPVL